MRRSQRAVFAAIALLAAGFVAWTYAAYRGDMQRARARVSVGSEVAQTRCGPIEYAVAGDGPPILFVHGAGGGFDQGLDFGGPLASDFRVVAMSRFGYLRTPLPLDASPAVQAEAHVCLLDALGIERAAVIGGSAGAPSSLELAVRYPERVSSLVLIVPAAYAPRASGTVSLPRRPGRNAFSIRRCNRTFCSGRRLESRSAFSFERFSQHRPRSSTTLARTSVRAWTRYSSTFCP